jgi:uncharacterized membrane protein
MHWLLFAVLGPLSWAISTHIDKYLVDKYFHNSDTAVLIVFTAAVGVFALPVIWFFEPRVLSLPPTAMGVMTVSGVLYMGAMLFYLRAIQSEEASAVAPFPAFDNLHSSAGLCVITRKTGPSAVVRRWTHHCRRAHRFRERPGFPAAFQHKAVISDGSRDVHRGAVGRCL